MMDDLKDTTTTEAVAEDWAKVKPPPRLTSLPTAVWITENVGYPRDVRVKASTLHGGRGSWRTAPSVAVRPAPPEIVPGSLPAADAALVSRWAAAVATLIALQDEYRTWLDNLPTSLEGSRLAEKLQAITELDIEELQAIDPPCGSGRD
jgi:hypothetical protein